ncbi:hypothetical protein [Paenibacillus sp. FSL R5-0701]|uniref:hypothetical protein n=1 Tax=Paenibacillus sp. FSL R5-0701 TaxID=2921654 RepID=UPI0030D47E33
MEPEKLLLTVRLMMGGGLLFLDQNIYQMYGHDLLNSPFMQIVFFLMFVATMHMFRKLSLFALSLDIIRDFYRLWKRRNKD